MHLLLELYIRYEIILDGVDYYYVTADGEVRDTQDIIEDLSEWYEQSEELPR